MTNLTIARNAMFEWLFFIFYVEIFKKNIVQNTSFLLYNSSALQQFLSTCKYFCNYKSFVFSFHSFYTSNLRIDWHNQLSMHIFLSSEYFQSHWYPTTKQRLILKAHVFNFPNRFWKVFLWNQILLQIWIGLLDLECLQ